MKNPDFHFKKSHGNALPPELLQNYSAERPMHRRLRTRLLNHYLLLSLTILLQVGVVLALFFTLGNRFSFLYTILTIVSVFVVIGILDVDTIAPAYKTIWLLVIMLLPPTGILFYLFWGQRSLRTRRAAEYRACWQRRREAQTCTPQAHTELVSALPQWERTSQYLDNTAGAPLFTGTNSTYYPFGQNFFTQYLADLEKAEKFIFIEYFIIDSGLFWDSVLEILTRKAAAGVDVRVIYDGVGSLLTLPLAYPKLLAERGIQCYKFAPVHVSMHLQDYTMMNHRDHRKITVIDGNVGFTGGINFADEYINLRRPYGIWKDTAVRLEGAAVFGLTSCFLENWDYLSRTQCNYNLFRPTLQVQGDGLVQPYGESPLVRSNVAVGLYLSLLQKCQKRAYIITPYLVIDAEMQNSLIRAAQSGVDVRIILPGIPDKKLVYAVSRSFYPLLLLGGVRIFEYTPGFTHAKMFLADEDVAVIGTANLDYRSLYLHFENCCAFYGGKILRDVERDFKATLLQCREITLEDERTRSLPTRIVQTLARLFAPLI